MECPVDGIFPLSFCDLLYLVLSSTACKKEMTTMFVMHTVV